MSFPGNDTQAEAAAATAGGQGGKTDDGIALSGSVFAVLQAYATHVFAPTVRAYAATRGGDDKVGGRVVILGAFAHLSRCAGMICVCCLHITVGDRHEMIPRDPHRPIFTGQFCFSRNEEGGSADSSVGAANMSSRERESFSKIYNWFGIGTLFLTRTEQLTANYQFRGSGGIILCVMSLRVQTVPTSVQTCSYSVCC